MNILVDTPRGSQEVIEVLEGGGYFDISRVVWDERMDGPLPPITGIMKRAGDILIIDDERTALAPVLVVPPVVTMAQARKAMILSGVTISSVNTAIEAIAGTRSRELAQTDWEYSATVRRDSGLIASLGAGLNLASDDIDAMFILAETL
jgi:hypothetical protein